MNAIKRSPNFPDPQEIAECLGHYLFPTSLPSYVLVPLPWVLFILTLPSLGRLSRVEPPLQLSVPGNLERKTSMSVPTVRKKKTIGIRALSAKQRKDDHIRALLKEHLSEIRALLRREVPVGVEVRNKF